MHGGSVQIRIVSLRFCETYASCHAQMFGLCQTIFIFDTDAYAHFPFSYLRKDYESFHLAIVKSFFDWPGMCEPLWNNLLVNGQIRTSHCASERIQTAWTQVWIAVPAEQEECTALCHPLYQAPISSASLPPWHFVLYGSPRTSVALLQSADCSMQRGTGGERLMPRR